MLLLSVSLSGSSGSRLLLLLLGVEDVDGGAVGGASGTEREISSRLTVSYTCHMDICWRARLTFSKSPLSVVPSS